MRPSDHSRSGSTLLLVLVVAVAGTAASGEEAGNDAAVAILADMQVEQTLLDEALERYAEHARRRSRAVDRLKALHAALDDAVRGGQQGTEALLEEVDRAEAERAELMTAQHVLVDKIDERRRRITLLREQLETLQAGDEKVGGPLAGRWDVVLMPLEHRGVFVLRQTGALVSGTYTLEGGWTGSLQGTLIDGKVHLVRIDSKLGRSMELEGRLSAGGGRVTGTWLNYELAGGDSSSGQWSARKSTSAP